MLIGQYKHTIDTKKRLSLPSKFRKELGRTVIITKSFENCLVVYPEKEWKEKSEKIGKLPESQDIARHFSRVKLGSATDVSLDKLGRILIPDYLKSYANLKKDVTIIGLSDRLEIWDDKKWEVYQKRAEKGIGKFASKLGPLGV